MKLTHKAPDAAAEAIYISSAPARSPVFRAEDHARTLNMDNNPAPKRAR